jgi:hypothetical protein
MLLVAYEVGVTDVNKDGAVDLIASDSLNYRIFVLLGNNAGVFALKTTIQNYSTPAEVFTGDFDNNGNPDVIVHGRLGADATVYLGNGNGSFSPGARYMGNGAITSIQLADMNGDGRQDMVTTGFGQTVDVQLGNADGTFSYGYSASAGTYSSLAAVLDLNHDVLPDLVTTSNFGLSVLLATGTTTFAGPVSFPAFNQFYGFHGGFGDFNRDGNQDYAANVAGGIAILEADGKGGFRSFDFYNSGSGVGGVTIADFNRDNRLDIAASGTAETKILLGSGNGKFNSIVSAGSNTASQKILSDDFNGDSNRDLFLLGITSILYGRGDATFGPSSVIQGFPEFGYTAASSGDFNGDHRADLVVAGYESFSVILSQPSGMFTVRTTFMPFMSSVAPAIADINKDGKLDFLLYVNGWLHIYLGNGDGTFIRGREFSTIIPGVHGMLGFRSMSLADLDQDGNLDLFGITDSESVAEVFWGLGDGTFEIAVLLRLSRPLSFNSIADTDSDGKPDIILNNDRLISVVPNLGDREFGPERYYFAGIISDVAVKDLNGDGYADIVVNNGGVAVLMNQPGRRNVRGGLLAEPQPSVEGAPFGLSLSIAAAESSTPAPTVHRTICDRWTGTRNSRFEWRTSRVNGIGAIHSWAAQCDSGLQWRLELPAWHVHCCTPSRPPRTSDDHNAHCRSESRCVRQHPSPAVYSRRQWETRLQWFSRLLR